jgi:hypothetical protein
MVKKRILTKRLPPVRETEEYLVLYEKAANKEIKQLSEWIRDTLRKAVKEEK